MRIVHFLVGSQEGGAEEFFMKLIEAQHGAGEDLLVVLGPHAKREAQLRALGVSFTVLSFEGYLSDFKSRRALKALIADFQPHVVQAWMSRAGRRLKKGPYVSVGRLGGYYPTRNYKGCDHLIANTPGILDFVLKDGWPEERAHLISNFARVRADKRVRRSDLDTDEEAKVLLAMGRLDESKGFDLILRALPSLPSHYVLWLAGVGPAEGALRGLAEAEGVADRVRFLGWRDDVSALYSEASVYVMSSRNEPLGNVVLEAFAAGVPVVALRSPGPEWIITPDHDGVMVEPEDVAGLSAAIGEVVEAVDLRERLISHARDTYNERFSKASILKQYKTFYERAYREKFGRDPD